jgi:hypothetical protein
MPYRPSTVKIQKDSPKRLSKVPYTEIILAEEEEQLDSIDSRYLMSNNRMKKLSKAIEEETTDMINYRHLQRKQKIIQRKYFGGEEVKELNPFDLGILEQDEPWEVYKNSYKEDGYSTIEKTQHVVNNKSVYDSPSPKKADGSYKHCIYK